MWLTLLLCLLGLGLQSSAADSVYAPLWLYQGAWHLRSKGQDKAKEIANVCKMVGEYFACEQSVDGKVGSLIVFVPRDKPGQYYVQGVLPDGHAAGRVELEINGDLWIYQTKSEEDGKTTYYRTTNVFTGKDQIHFEQSESPDGLKWTITSSGDESRSR
jgi:hypothetical protein